MKCGKFEHNAEEDISFVKVKINAKIRDFLNATDETIPEIISGIVNSIVSANLYSLDSEEEINSLQKAIEAVVEQHAGLKRNPAVISKIKNSLDKVLGNIFFSIIGNRKLDTDSITLSPDEVTSEIEDIKENELRTIDQLFPKGSIIKSYLSGLFQGNLTDIALFNPEKGTITRNNSDLNKNIADYKEQLYSDLIEALSQDNISVEGITDTLYDTYGVINKESLIKLIKLGITRYKDYQTQIKNDYFSKFKDSKADKRLKGYIAYSLLQNGNFDHLLKNMLGKNFGIKDIYFGKEINRTEDKYSIGSDNKMRKGWNETDNIDVMDSTTGIAKLLVERTPIYKHSTGELQGSNTVTLRQFYNTFNKILTPEFLETHKSILGLKDLLTKVHGDSYKIKDIIKTLYNNLNRIKLPSYNKDIIYSIYKRFYDDSENNPTSLWNMENIHIKNAKAVTSYSIIEIINNLITRSSALTYTTYQFDGERKSIVSKHIMQSNNMSKRLKRENFVQVLTKNREDRNELINKYNIEILGESNKISFELSSGDKQYSFVYNLDDKVFESMDYNFLNNSTKFTDVLDRPDLKFEGLSEKLFASFIEFSDDLIGTEFTAGDKDLFLALESVYASKNMDYITKGLMSMLAKTAYINKVYADQANPNINTENLPLKDFVSAKYSTLIEINKYKFYDDTDDSLRVVDKNNLDGYENFASAEQIVTQEIVKSVVKDSSGNNLANNGITNLASNLKYFIQNRIINNEKTPLKGNIFVENYEALLNPSIKTDVKLRDGRTKSVKQFTEAELAYSSIILDFFGTSKNTDPINSVASVYSDKTRMYMWEVKPNLKVNGKSINLKTSPIEEIKQAFIYSIGSYYHNLDNNIVQDYINTLFTNGNLDPMIVDAMGKHLSQLNESIHYLTEISNTIQNSDSYKFELSSNIIGKKIKELQKVNEKIVKLQDRIAKFTEAKTNLDNLIQSSSQAYNEKIQSIDVRNQEIRLANDQKKAVNDFNLIPEIPVPEFSLGNMLLENKEIIKEFIKFIPESVYDDLSFSKGIENIIHLHSSRDKVGIVEAIRSEDGSEILELKDKSISFMKPNTGIQYLIKQRFPNLEEVSPIFQQEYEREKKRFVKDLIAANVNFYTVGKDGTPIPEMENILKGGTGFVAEWVNPEFKELIIAKDSAGNPITKLNNLTDIRDYSTITLNPMLERYFISNMLIQQNLRLASVGTEFNHPNKAKGFKGDLTMADFELEEAARWGAQNKRNVIIPATLMNYGLNSITGIKNEMNVAIIEDLGANVYNYKGDKAEIDSHDGSVWSNPLHAILENLSLQDQAVGEDKKPIGHDYSGKYGSSLLFKCATFMLTNEKMRVSQRSPINGLNLFRKMSDFNWNDAVNRFNAEKGTNYELDLTKNLFGKDMTLSDILGDKSIFVKRGNRYFQIIGLQRISPDNYSVIERQVTKEGKPLGNDPIRTTTKISSLYDLHQAFGGVYSMGLKDGKLIYDDSSLQVAARYMNNVGLYYGDKKSFPTQENTFQPLKYDYIAHIANTSAVKQGAQHINSSDRWHDDTPFKYMKMLNDGTGVQMDSDHIVTDDHGATMSEPTQVTSALEANGLTHNITTELYRDLGKVSLALVQDELEAMDEYKDLDPKKKSAVYELVGKVIIKNMKKESREIGLTRAIIDKVKDNFKSNKNHLQDEYKIPFSDPNIFSAAINAMASALNKSAIKRKFPGSGSVMSPAYNFMQVFQDEYGNIKSYDDLINEADVYGASSVEEYLDRRQENLESNPLNIKTIDQLLPGENVKLILEDNSLKEVSVDSIDVYNEIKKGSYLGFYPVINKSRNLKPSEIYWTIDGKRFCIYDLPIIQEAFNLRSSKKLSKSEDIELQNKILQAFELLEKGKVKINNTVLDIDPGSLVNNPAEMIVSKMYMSTFGLDQDDSIGAIKAQGKEFFINKYDSLHTPKVNNNEYDLMFTSANGKHMYIILGERAPSNLVRIDTSEDQYTEDNVIYRTDKEGNKLYPLYNITEDEEGNRKAEPIIIPYYSENNQEILFVRDVELLSKLYETIEFDGALVNKDTKNPTEVINALETHKDNIRDFSYLLNSFPESNISDSAKLRAAVVRNLSYVNLKKQKYAQERYTSFLKSQEFVVARIPSQTLQSFMKMNAVQFTSSDKNVVYVSHWQTWLQGSDY